MRLRNCLIIGSLCLLLAACGGKPQVLTVARAEAVAYPARPELPQLVDGDVACMSYEARQRLGARHIVITKYVADLEAALKAYDAQAVQPAQPGGRK